MLTSYPTLPAGATPFQGRRVCVTGGAGFIGSHLVEALVGAGADVAVIDDLSNGFESNLATVRDRSRSLLRKRIYGFLALGWRGSHRGWQHYERAYLIFAGISTPLVLSVHSVVSFDFATSVIPGWHTTIFPPYFVAGAVFSGFALVMTMMLIVRAVFGMHNLVNIRHLDLMNKFMLGTSMIVGYAYAMEFFIAWYGGNTYEMDAFIRRAFGSTRGSVV